MLDIGKIEELREFYRKHLLEDVMSFWEPRTRDTECGGYFTCFDRMGEITDTDKYVWFQGRQLWMTAALYNEVGRDEKWLDLARHGRDFLVKHAYAGDGRWHYQLDRAGNVKQGTISIFSDLFVVSGLAEYAVASGSDEDVDLIKTVYDTIERNVHDLDFKDIYHNTWNPKYKRHGVYMISVITAPIVGKVLGETYTRPLIDHSLEQILYVFARDEHEALVEAVGRDDSFMDDEEGRVVYPGHTLESCWASIEEGLRQNDRSIIDRALTIADWGYEWGYDKEFGGIVSYRDVSGDEPLQTDWNREVGMQWHDKNFWVNAEAIYVAALTAVERDDEKDLERFLRQHEWCQKHLYDPAYGEWYSELYRDGSVKLADKGTMWKAAYHVPRAIMLTYKAFDRYLREHES
jgi:N-acylglucosamine 2-epimerase